MSSSAPKDPVPGRPGERFEPYVRLIRSLLPGTSCVSLFGAAGEFRWSTDTASGPDLTNFIDDALHGAQADPQHSGKLGLLGGSLPVYLCPLRDGARQLLAILAVVCAPLGAPQAAAQEFARAHARLAPVLECLGRELGADPRPGKSPPAAPSRCAPEEHELAWYAGAAR